MANLSNINDKFLVTAGGNVLIGATADVATVRLQVKNASAAAVLRLTGGSDSWDFDTYYTDNKLFIKSSGAAGTVMTLLGANGNVGIGTDSPDCKLHIAESTNNSGSVGALANGGLQVENTNTTANSWSQLHLKSVAYDAHLRLLNNGLLKIMTDGNVDAMSITNAGNVGIGGAPDNLLTLTGTAGSTHQRFKEASTTIGFIGGANGIITGHNGKIALRAEAGLVLSSQGNSADVVISSGNSTFAGEISSGDDINVVNGKLTVNTTSAEVRIKSTSDTGESFINFADPSDNNVGQIYYGHGTNKMSIRVNDATRLEIDSSGNTTITTTSNQGGLTVTSATDNTVLGINNTATGGQTWRLQSTGGSSGLGAGKLFLKVGGTETAANLISFVTGGSGADIKMGIGTTAPAELLEVKGASGLDGATPPTIKIQSSSSGTWTDDATFAKLAFGQDDTAGGIACSINAYVDSTTGNNSGLSFYTSGSANTPTEKMRITQAGELNLGGHGGQFPVLKVVGLAGGVHTGSTWAISANQDGIGRTILATGGQARAMYFENDGKTVHTQLSYFDKGVKVDMNAATTFTGEFLNTNATSYGLGIRSNSGYQVFFYDTGGNIGSITSNGSNTAYNTSGSDERLKENIEVWDENVLDKFKNLQPKTFKFIKHKQNNKTVKGYIAQNEVDNFPEAYPMIYDIDAKEDMYQFNPSGMTVYLMKAIQELKAEIDELKNK